VAEELHEDAAAIWSACLESLEGSGSTHKAWLAQTRPVAVVGALLVIASMGILTYRGATAEESLGAENVEQVDEWVEVQGLSEEGAEGATLFAEITCMSCHTYLGAGSSQLGAPDLSEIGATGRTAEEFATYVANPAEFGNNIMPAYEDQGEEVLMLLGTFLEESKGDGGGG